MVAWQSSVWSCTVRTQKKKKIFNSQMSMNAVKVKMIVTSKQLAKILREVIPVLVNQDILVQELNAQVCNSMILIEDYQGRCHEIV